MSLDNQTWSDETNFQNLKEEFIKHIEDVLFFGLQLFSTVPSDPTLPLR